MPRRTPRTKKSQPEIFELRVTLEDVTPPVWRKLLVHADLTLGDLHAVLQIAMGWHVKHLHQFVKGGRTLSDLELYEDAPPEVEDQWIVRLNQLVGVGESLRYEYDFGDGWSHEVKVEAARPFDPRLHYPLCIGGARACPPEDVGGPYGYQDIFLPALADPKNDQHDHYTEWIGGYFDPEGFNANEVNEGLRELVAEAARRAFTDLPRRRDPDRQRR